jgi:hypothetical protein
MKSAIICNLKSAARNLNGSAVTYGACVASFALGLFFIFVWAPHPWGWAGFDHYDDFGRQLARGEPYPTLDRPWGYAWYLAPFYRVFGDRPWIPLAVQALFNAVLPLLIDTFARPGFGNRIATVAAVFTGLFSFNTVYASTQSPDALCTVLFTAAIVSFAHGHRHHDWRLLALAGILLGLAAQFRPNMILMPLVLAAFLMVARRIPGRTLNASALLSCAALVLLPWIVRNARLTGELIPASTHGGLQLWYGTLQTGPYLKSRAYNPRKVFEAGSFPYTSLDRVPLVVTARLAPCAGSAPRSLALVYWTDRNPEHMRVVAGSSEPRAYQAGMAPLPAPTTYYFYLEARWPENTLSRVPEGGDRAPYVYLVSTDHLGDLDRFGDLLDVFDLVRLLRHVAWSESTPASDRVDLDGDGRLTAADIGAVVDTLVAASGRPHVKGAPQVVFDATRATLRLADGSTMTVPRVWSNRITDVDVHGGMAEAVLHTTVPLAALRTPGAAQNACGGLENVAVNAVYYREQPHAMRRYLALSFDNIRRTPGGYLAAVAYRSVRVFFIEGSSDPQTTQQFSGSGRVYRLAYVASVGAFVLFLIGVRAAWRRGCDITLPLVAIVYIPATLAFVLTNMRYSVTVQPLIFVFVATAVVSALERLGIWRCRENTSSTTSSFGLNLRVRAAP